MSPTSRPPNSGNTHQAAPAGAAAQRARQALTPAVAYRRRWIALAVLAMADFVVILDASIVNVALPSIGRALGLSQDGLSWVVNAYVLTFGGFLLLGGRLADLLGRRRMFITSLVVFSAASLAGGLAPSGPALVAARAVQGLAAAVLAPRPCRWSPRPSPKDPSATGQWESGDRWPARGQLSACCSAVC